MKKTILSFTLLFAVLFINSCKDDEVVNTDVNTSGIPRIKSIEEVMNNGKNNATRTFNFSYKDNLPKSITFYYNNIHNSTFNYQYNSNKEIEKLIVDVNQNGQSNESIVSFYYKNNNIDYLESYFNNEILFYTKYQYSANQLTEMYALNYEDGEMIDSTHYSELENGRPTIIKLFSKNDKNEIVLKTHSKFVYQNGNLVEEYVMNEENSEWQISKKYFYDLTKDNAYLSFKDFVTPFSNVEVYNKNDFNKNFLIKEEIYDIDCNGTIHNTPVIVEEYDYTGTYNTKTLLEKYKSINTANCSQKNRYNSEMTLTWE